MADRRLSLVDLIASQSPRGCGRPLLELVQVGPPKSPCRFPSVTRREHELSLSRRCLEGRRSLGNNQSYSEMTNRASGKSDIQLKLDRGLAVLPLEIDPLVRPSRKSIVMRLLYFREVRQLLIALQRTAHRASLGGPSSQPRWRWLRRRDLANASMRGPRGRYFTGTFGRECRSHTAAGVVRRNAFDRGSRDNITGGPC